MSVLAIDAGTTGVTALVVTEDGRIAAKGYQEFAQHFPQPGWVEHAPEEIWQATLAADARGAGAGTTPSQLQAVGITNQRETVVLWDRETLGSPAAGDRLAGPAHRRDLRRACATTGHEERVTELTGLRLDPYFSGTKLTWLAEHEPHTWALVESGRYAVGTVDSYLIARMTRGTWHVTDVSNASPDAAVRPRRPATGPTSCATCSAYPATHCPSWCPTGARSRPPTRRRSSASTLPIAGHRRRPAVGALRADLLRRRRRQVHLRHRLVHPHQHRHALERSDAGLLTTVAWRSPDGELTYALEGAIFVTGAAVQWLRDGLQIVGSAAETEAIAATVRLLGGRRVRAGADRPRRPALGPARTRH